MLMLNKLNRSGSRCESWCTSKVVFMALEKQFLNFTLDLFVMCEARYSF